MEAESIAFTIAETLGISTSTYSFPYVKNWASGIGDPAAVQATAERFISRAREILTGPSSVGSTVEHLPGRRRVRH